MISLNQKEERIKAIVEAVKNGSSEDIRTAVTQLYEGIYEGIRADFIEFQQTNDERVLEQRGYRQLTSAEKKFYEKMIQSVKEDKPLEKLLQEVPEDAMPTSIIEDAYKEIKQEHPLLEAINFHFVGTTIKWILSDHTSQKAKWGKITDEIVEEITSGLKEIDITQNKLSAFIFIEQGMLEMGPVFLNGYVKEVLKESLALGAEAGFISGTGVNEPIGMDRDIHEGVEVSTVTGYPKKEAIKLKSFMPTEYGPVLARLATTEKGNNRTFDEVTLICNQTDYLSKVMPSSVMLTGNGSFAKDVFPFATNVIRSSSMATGEALLGLPEEYSAFLGSNKEGVIESSDEYKFVEDLKTFKIKLYGTGRAYDNTCWLLIDISELEPLYMAVMNMKDLIIKQEEEADAAQETQETVPTA